jgi:hypothetical protein
MHNFLSSPRRVVLIVVSFAILIAGLFLLFNLNKETPEGKLESIETEEPATKQEVIGRSVEGRDIEAYTYGTGADHLLFVGGIHGGYEWNSVLLAYEFIDYLDSNPETVLDNLSVTIIPSLNPDGVFKIIGKEDRFSQTDVKVDREGAKPGRFNANEVDLNRNFDCKWQPESTWQSRVVNAGTAPFSEPEAKALRDFVLEIKPEAVVFWHSQANAVYASECEEGILPETLQVMNVYSKASGYPSVDSFDYYEVTGDAEGWLASIGISAITVELQTNESIEWVKNLAGVEALFKHFSSN